MSDYSHRLANAAAQAAQPLLGYLSGHNPYSSSSSSSPAAGPYASSSAPSRPGTAPPGSRGGVTASSGAASAQQQQPPRSSSASRHRATSVGAGNTGTSASGAGGSGRGWSGDAQLAARRQDSISEEARRKESKNLDSIVSQFHSKAAQVVTQARFTHLQTSPSETSAEAGPSSRREASTSSGATTPAKRTRNRWFNLEMEESEIFKEELRTWRSVTNLLGSAPPLPSARSSRSASSSPSSSGSLAAQANYSAVPAMVIDVILDTSDISGNQVLILNDPNGKRHKVDLSGSGRHSRRAGMGIPGPDEGSPKKCNIVLERWTVSLKGPPPATPPELPTVYKHCIILFRALYTLTRALPAFELHRRQKRRQGRAELKIGCRLSASDLSASSSSSGRSVPPRSRGSSGQDARYHSDSAVDDSADNSADAMELGLDDSLGEGSSSFSVQDFAFMPIVTPLGLLDVRCRYRSCVDFSVEEIEALLSSRFIDEDFFRPTMRKYSTSTGAGSLPIRGSLGSHSPHTHSVLSSQRPQYGSLPRPLTQTGQPTSIAPSHDEGAFASYGRAGGAQALSRMHSYQGTSPSGGATTLPSGAPALIRRPSVGTSHPFKPGPSAAVAAAPPQRQLSSTPPMASAVSVTPPQEALPPAQPVSRVASSPGSSLRYSLGQGPTQQQQQQQAWSGAGSFTPLSGAAGASSSQLSYTKRSIPSPISAHPPISGLTAMNLGSSPSSFQTAPSSLPAFASAPSGTTAPAAAGSSGGAASAPIALSASPTPSLIKRYSSSRYSRSFGRESSGSSPGGQSYWPGDVLDRRSRLSSTGSREDAHQRFRSDNAGTAGLPSRSGGTGTEGLPEIVAGDAEDIRSFLGLLDSQAQLPSHSVLMGGPGAGAGRRQGRGGGVESEMGAGSTVLSRTLAEEKLRNLANSVYRDIGGSRPGQTMFSQQQSSVPPSAGSSASGSGSGSRPLSIIRQQHQRRRSGGGGEASPTSFPPSRSALTPSPDQYYAYSASPSELPGSASGSISGSGGGGALAPFASRIRASQPPMSSSIPEEDPHIAHRQGHPPSQAERPSSASPRTTTPPYGSLGAHSPFPRYVSSSMRRRESSQSSGAGPSRPSILPASRGGSASNSQIAADQHRQGQTSDELDTSSRLSPSMSPSASPSPSTQIEDAEEQTMGTLDLGLSSSS